MWPHINIDLGVFHGQLHLYLLMLGCGLCHLFIGVDSTARRQQIDPKIIGNFNCCLCAAFLGGLVSSLLITKLFYGSKVALGTMSVMPGILGGAGTLWFAALYLKVPLRECLQLGLPFLCFAHAWGRLGCFLGGCCFGKPTDSFCGVQFPTDSPACMAYGHVPVHPTQLYEFTLLVALGLALQFAIPAVHRIHSYLLLYGISRFGIEFFRGDDRGNLGMIPGLSPSQQLCLFFIAAGAVLAWRQQREVQGVTQPRHNFLH